MASVVLLKNLSVFSNNFSQTTAELSGTLYLYIDPINLSSGIYEICATSATAGEYVLTILYFLDNGTMSLTELATRNSARIFVEGNVLTYEGERKGSYITISIRLICVLKPDGT